MLRRELLMFALLVGLGACGGEPKEDAAPAAIDGPKTTETTAAAAPAASTSTAEPTTNPTATVTVELTAAATATEEPASIPATPTAAAAPVAASVTARQSSDRPLKVSFTNLHYECMRECWQQGRPPHESKWGYYSLQVLMTVENVSPDKTLNSPWIVSRWTITDGVKTWTDNYAWQWTRGDDGGVFDQPAVPPGGKNEWTWLAFPVPHGAWVSGIEYTDPWGNTYRQGLSKPAFGEYDYQDCGPPFGGGC